MKDLTETVISIVLAVALIATVISFYGTQLTSMVTKAFDSVPK